MPESQSEVPLRPPICGGKFRDVEHLKEWVKDVLEEPNTSTLAKVAWRSCMRC